MKLPCETISKKVLPTIRAILVKKLHKQNLTQTEIAEKLGITQPAVSQYLKSLRGNEKIETRMKKENIYSEIETFADRIRKNPISEEEKTKKFCELCKKLREEGIV